MYYITNYYTDEIIETTKSFSMALLIAEDLEDIEITDENDNVYYCNVELPF